MNITTKQLINILPTENQLKQVLLERYDALAPAQQQMIADICWTSFYSLWRNETEKEFQKQLATPAPNFKLNNNLHQEIEKKVYNELMAKLGVSEQQVGLDEVRQKLQTIIQSSTTAPVETPPKQNT